MKVSLRTKSSGGIPIGSLIEAAMSRGEQSVAAASEKLAEGAAALAPEHLKGAIEVLPASREGGKVLGGVVVRHPDAQATEFGTEAAGPDPFLRRAADEVADRLRGES